MSDYLPGTYNRYQSSPSSNYNNFDDIYKKINELLSWKIELNAKVNKLSNDIYGISERDIEYKINNAINKTISNLNNKIDATEGLKIEQSN